MVFKSCYRRKRGGSGSCSKPLKGGLKFLGNIESSGEVGKVRWNADSQAFLTRDSIPGAWESALGWTPQLVLREEIQDCVLRNFVKWPWGRLAMLQSDCDAGLSIVKDSLDVATEYGLQEFYPLQFFPLMNHSRGKKKKSLLSITSTLLFGKLQPLPT